jgi:hypothetical protein
MANYMNEQDNDLFQFFGGYFHQDWELDNLTWQDVIRHFVQDVEREEPITISTKINRLLASSVSDEDLCKVVQDLGCYYWPGSASDMRPWLNQLAQALRQEVG